MILSELDQTLPCKGDGECARKGVNFKTLKR